MLLVKDFFPNLIRLQKRILWTSIALIVSAFGIFLCAMPYLVTKWNMICHVLL